MIDQNLNQVTKEQNENRSPEYDSQKSDSTSRTANSGMKPDEQKLNQVPRANELYEEELPPESRVISKAK